MAVLESESVALVDTLGEELPIQNSTGPAMWESADRSHQPIVMIAKKITEIFYASWRCRKTKQKTCKI